MGFNARKGPGVPSAPAPEDDAAITLPYEFDTSDVWRTILKGAFGLTALIAAVLLYELISRKWAAAAAFAGCEAMLVYVTRLFVRFQTGSVGTLSADRVVIQPNRLFGFLLPGPAGTYTLDRFSAVRVEFHPGPIGTDVQSGGPNEIVWLVGRPGTPDIALARTEDGAGRSVGRELSSVLSLPMEEAGAPKVIRLLARR